MRNLSQALILIIVITWLCAAAGFVQAQDIKPLSKVNIESQEKWRTLFGGEECIYHFQITSNESIEGRTGWSLRYANRTINQGECTFEAEPGKGGLIEIRLKVPPVNEGVMMPVPFAVRLYQKGEKEALASWEETLYIFSKDPFALKKEWLKGLKIGLFDPEGKTQAVFQELGIPFSIKNNIDGLSEFDGSLLVVGSGLNFLEYSGLWGALLNLCRQKISVLVLAPRGGFFPSIEEIILNESNGIGIRFLKRDIIHQLDKKLDVVAWPPDGKVVTSTMTVYYVHKAGLVGEFGPVPGDIGWPWFEIDFAGKEGKIVICGFGIIEKIKDGPTPRFLLARLFEYLTGSEK